MKFTLAFVLLDLGVPWYKTAASEMIRSARRAYKDHDMTVVQLTDNRTAHHPDADGYFGLETDVKGNQLAQAKGHLMAEFALKAGEPVIFCDVDMIWNNDHILTLADGADIALLERDYPAMPFNTGIVVAMGRLPGFWKAYRAACDSLPPEVCGWWGDQLALAPAMLDFDYSAFNRMPMDEIAPAITDLPTGPLTTPAVHFKGEDAKRFMIPYARLVDMGAQFEFARPGQQFDMGEMSAASRNALDQQGWAF